jgi:heptaprenyl diphosphate synthase
MRRPETKRLALGAMLVAFAMILSYVESLVPPLVAIPGVKLGLANIATVFVLYCLGERYAVSVSLMRVVLSSLLFGNAVSLVYSLAGAVLSLIFMILLRRIGIFTAVGVSAAGGVAHNAGQIICAALIMENAGLTYYLAPLTVTGVISGCVIGIAAGFVLGRMDKINYFTLASKKTHNGEK